MRIRPNTWDAKIVNDVLLRNEYALPDDLRGAVIVDIGAHIGAFTIACMKRNARQVWAYEPDPENFKLLAYNLSEEQKDSNQTEVLVCDSAVAGEDTTNAFGIRRLTEHDFDKGRNTGHIDIFGLPDGTETTSIAKVLGRAERIDILKIDCEGAEWLIFEVADFSNVCTLVAELHDISAVEVAPIAAIKKPFQEMVTGAIRKLRQAGFETNIMYESSGTAKLTASRETIAEVRSDAKDRPKVLWIGDACVNTGFARVTHNICGRLHNLGWDVRILGIGYNGDPHKYPYQIYPSVDPNTGGNRLGLTRLPELMRRIKPDIVIAQDDSWNVGLIADHMAMLNLWAPTIAYVAVDSENVRDDVAAQLRNLKHIVCHTQFGATQLIESGYNGPISVMPHGVDAKLYTTYNKKEAREGIQAKHADIPNAFIWGVVAANQPRKRLDLTMQYFAEWWKQAGKPDNVFLYLHTNPDGSWDLKQMADYLGIRGRYLATKDGLSLPEDCMPTLYSAFDALISTSEGESFGLPHLEAMSCGIPQIAVSCGGLPSWAGDAIYWVKPSSVHFLEGRINAKRYVASQDDFVSAMMDFYASPALRDNYAHKGLELSKRFSWDTLAKHFDGIMRGILDTQRVARRTETDCLAEFT